MQTLIVNMFGGPGSGKSTLAAGLFAELKRAGISCELVAEYVKEWAWEGKQVRNYDEFYIFGQQVRRETRLYGKVPVLITDRPLELSAVFSQFFGLKGAAEALAASASEIRAWAKQDGHSCLDIKVRRTPGYDQNGRFQTEQESNVLDGMIEKAVPRGYRYSFFKDEHAHLAKLVMDSA